MAATLLALFVVGAFIGSFLNVCIYRLPRGESVVWPGSHCPSCNQPVAPYDNVPVLSYLLLLGKCRRCRAPISIQYPLVEVLNGLAYVLVVWRFGLTWPALAYAAFCSALIVVSGIDLEHQIIPDRITLPGLAIGLVAAATILPITLVNAVIGVAVGGGLLWLLAWLSPYLFGKEGMGGGDIKLMGMVGAFLGWKPALLTIMLGAIAGSVLGITLIAIKLLRRDQYIPFGPFLALGAVVALFFADDLLAWYQSFLPAAP
ncbi:MAG: prepilin peptidase [Nitrospirae bacterium]|nr:prepilin peptidase [Nitrospirota bacterium]